MARNKVHYEITTSLYRMAALIVVNIKLNELGEIIFNSLDVFSDDILGSFARSALDHFALPVIDSGGFFEVPPSVASLAFNDGCHRFWVPARV